MPMAKDGRFGLAANRPLFEPPGVVAASRIKRARSGLGDNTEHPLKTTTIAGARARPVRREPRGITNASKAEQPIRRPVCVLRFSLLTRICCLLIPPPWGYWLP